MKSTPYSSYSPDFTPSDFYRFNSVKEPLAGFLFEKSDDFLQLFVFFLIISKIDFLSGLFE
jgi:hypothetical protein